MSKMRFTDEFTKSLAVLLFHYNNAPVTLTEADMEKYLENVIENGKYINECVHGNYHKFSDWSFWKDLFPKQISCEKVFQTPKMLHIYVLYLWYCL